MRKDWKNSLRDSLSDFQAPDPEGLWAAVEKRIAAGDATAGVAGVGAEKRIDAGEGRSVRRILVPLSLALAGAAALLLILLLPGKSESSLEVLPATTNPLTAEVLSATAQPLTAEGLPTTTNTLTAEDLLATTNPQTPEMLPATADPLTAEVLSASRQNPVAETMSGIPSEKPEAVPSSTLHPPVAETLPSTIALSDGPLSGINDSNGLSDLNVSNGSSNSNSATISKALSDSNGLSVSNDLNNSNDSQTFKTDNGTGATDLSDQSIDDFSTFDEPQRQTAQRPRINLLAMASGTPSSHSSTQNYSALPCSDIATSLQSLNCNDFAYRNFSSTVTSNLGSEISTKTTHRQPIRLAIEAEYMLTDCLGLVSGLSFSRLVSDLTSGGENYYHTVQKLDYLGMPLSLNWYLLNSQRLTLYTKLGAMVEKCISGSAATSYSLYGESVQGEQLTVVDQPLVFSLDASMGFGMKLWSTGRSGSRRGGNSAAAGVGQPGGYGAYLFNAASIVIEPGLSWHIPDGGTISNIYRDRPLNFSLTIALRFSL